ncbi:MAG: dihydrofolate reductase [Rubrivivax sp.]
MSHPPSPPPRLELIAAVARNGAIGHDNALLWHDPLDQRHFRARTIGAPVLMGRRTWDSLPARFCPLPGRRNLVLSRDPQWQADGAERVGTLEQALALAGADGAARLAVIGGAAVYALALPRADRLLLTELDADLEGDTFFPPWSRAAFRETARAPQVGHDGTAFAFVTYDRVLR